MSVHRISAGLFLVATLLAGCPLNFQSAPPCANDGDCRADERCTASVCVAHDDPVDGGVLRDGGNVEPDVEPELEPDAGHPPGDAGVDGGRQDAGLDAGGQTDAGEIDGGGDAGQVDAGPVDGGDPFEVFAVDDTFDVVEDALSPSLNVTDNDVIPADANVRVEVVGAIPAGVALDSNGAVTLSFAPHYFGVVTFDYKLVSTTSGAESAPATATIDVQSVNDVPEITDVNPPTISLARGGTQTIDVVATDVEDIGLQYSFSADGTGVTVEHANPDVSTASISADVGAPLEASTVTVTVSDSDGGVATLTVPVTVSGSMLLLDVEATATSLFAGESITFDASGTTSTAGGLSFVWRLEPPVSGVSLSPSDADTSVLTIDRTTYYADNGHGPQVLPVELEVSDAAGTTQVTTIAIQVLDERGPYVRGNAAFAHPCGRLSRPCTRISDAIASQRELIAEGIATPPAVYVHEATPIVEDATIVIDDEIDLRCGYIVEPDGTWSLSADRTRIDVADAVAIRHQNTGATTISNCEVRNVAAVGGQNRTAIQVVNRARLINLNIIGSVNAGAVDATGIHFLSSSLSSEVSDVTVLGAQGAATGAARGIVAFSPVTLTDCDVTGGRSFDRSIALVAGDSAAIVVVGGDYAAGNSNVNNFGFLVEGTADVSVTGATIVGANAGNNEHSIGVRATNSGTVHLEDTSVYMSQIRVNGDDIGLSFRPTGGGTMTLLNTTVGDTAISVPRATNSIGIDVDDTDASGAFFGMTNGSVHPPDANGVTYGVRALNCFDFALDTVDISLDVAPLAVGVHAVGDCLATITDVDISNEAGNNTNVSTRIGIGLIDTSATITGGTITLNSAQVLAAGVRLEEDGGAAATIADLTVLGHRAQRSIGLDLSTAYSDLTVTNSQFLQMYTAVEGGVAYGINAENGCSRCSLGQLNITLSNSLGGNTKNAGLRVYSPGSSDWMTLYSSVVDPAAATLTSGIETIGASPARGNDLSVAVLGSTVHSGTGVGTNHVAIDMRHESNSNEDALDVIGTVIFIDGNSGIGFREECGVANNHNGTRVGRAENIAFQEYIAERTLLSNARKVGSNCTADLTTEISAFNGDGPYAEETATDTSIYADLLLDDDIRPGPLSPVIGQAQSLLEYYPATAPQPFVDLNGQDRSIGSPDIGAAEYVP